jgi:hypothetical protein
VSALSAEQARRYLAADKEVADARAVLKEAERKRDELRERYRPRLSLGEPVRAGGVEIVVKAVAKAASFRLMPYLHAGNEVTKEMEPFHTPAGTREDWQAKKLPVGS